MNEQVQVSVTDPTTQLRANVYETPGGDSYVIEIPVPGVKPDEISIEVTVDTVTVRTEPRQQQDESERKYVQREHSVESMSRVFEFPRELDTDNVRATLEKRHLEGSSAKGDRRPPQGDKSRSGGVITLWFSNATRCR